MIENLSDIVNQLQRAIQNVLPSDFFADTVGTAIHISSKGTSSVISLPIDYAFAFANGDESRLAYVLESQFGHLQDYVAETTGEAWPGRKIMPKPVVSILPHRIRISYQGGDSDTIVLDEIEI